MTWRLNHHRSFWVCFSHASTSALLSCSYWGHSVCTSLKAKLAARPHLPWFSSSRWHTWLLFWHGWGLHFCDQGLPWYASAFLTVSSQPLFLLFLPLKIEPFLGLNLGFPLLVHLTLTLCSASVQMIPTLSLQPRALRFRVVNSLI